jgi:hypothetical protein
MVQNTARCGIDIRVWILGLSMKSSRYARKYKKALPYLPMFFENIRCNLEGLQRIENKHINRQNPMNSDLVHKINDRTALQLRSGVTELLESDETRIRVAQNTMSIPELAKVS